VVNVTAPKWLNSQVVGVKPGSQAESIDIRIGHVFTEIAGEPITSSDDFEQHVESLKVYHQYVSKFRMFHSMFPC
jgi:S1-C subfamily serine protease